VCREQRPQAGGVVFLYRVGEWIHQSSENPAGGATIRK
jgi:hypothetical protein